LASFSDGFENEAKSGSRLEEGTASRGKESNRMSQKSSSPIVLVLLLEKRFSIAMRPHRTSNPERNIPNLRKSAKSAVKTSGPTAVKSAAMDMPLRR
jgi:hypothetical protein